MADLLPGSGGCFTADVFTRESYGPEFRHANFMLIRTAQRRNRMQFVKVPVGLLYDGGMISLRRPRAKLLAKP